MSYSITRENGVADAITVQEAINLIKASSQWDHPVVERLRELRDSIEEQVKPTVPEPDQFGSIVRATCGPGLVGILWQRSPMHGKHYWESETGAVEVWPELTDVEVLRVGVGEAGIPEAKVRSLVGELYRLSETAITAPSRECWDRAHDLVAALLDEDGR